MVGISWFENNIAKADYHSDITATKFFTSIIILGEKSVINYSKGTGKNEFVLFLHIKNTIS